MWWWLWKSTAWLVASILGNLKDLYRFSSTCFFVILVVENISLCFLGKLMAIINSCKLLFPSDMWWNIYCWCLFAFVEQILENKSFFLILTSFQFIFNQITDLILIYQKRTLVLKDYKLLTLKSCLDCEFYRFMTWKKTPGWYPR